MNISYGLMLRPDIEAATADQILPMLRNNLGIGFVPKAFLSDLSENAGIHMLPLRQSIPPRSICLVKDKGHPLSIAVRKLEQMILQTADR